MKNILIAALLLTSPALAQTTMRGAAPDGFIFKSGAEIDAAVSKPEAGRAYGATFMNDHENYYIEFVKRLDHGNMVELHPHWVDQITIIAGEGVLTFGGMVRGGDTAPNGELRGGTQTGARIIKLGPGDFVLIPAGSAHKFDAAPGEIADLCGRQGASVKRALTALLMLTLPAQAAANWVQVGRTPASVAMSVDRASVQAANGHVTYWDRFLYPEPHPIGVYDNTPISGDNLKGTTFFVEMRGFHDVDCVGKTILTTREEFYDASGAMVSRAASVIGPKPMPPGSVGADEAAIVCPVSTPHP